MSEVIDLRDHLAPPLGCARPSRFPSGRTALDRPQVAAGGRAPVLAYRRYRFVDLVRLLALDDMAPSTQVERLRLMFRKRRLPAPLNARVWKGEFVEGERAISTASVWDAADVDAHLHQPGPTTPAPATAAHPRAPAANDLHEAMLANARRLAGMPAR